MAIRRHRHPRRGRQRVRVSIPGSAPGDFKLDPEALPSKMRVMAFGPEGFIEADLPRVSDLDAYRGKWPVTWVNVDGLGDGDLLRELRHRFNLHKLAVEDVVHTPQRAKFEAFEEHLFVIVRMPHADEGVFEQVSLFIGDGWLLSFQESAGDCLDGIRDRIRTTGPAIRLRGSDYLGYAILDAVIDSYFPQIESVGDRLDDLEDEVLLHPTRQTMHRIHALKRHLVTLRSVVWPHRDAVNGLIRDSGHHLQPETLIHLRDCYDHTIRIIDLIETQREIAADLMGTYLSSISNRMNEVMKVLTIIATIFIPLSFVAGVYGMNFDTSISPWNMPELGWRFGYPIALGGMGAVGIAMLAWFWRKGWFD